MEIDTEGNEKQKDDYESITTKKMTWNLNW